MRGTQQPYGAFVVDDNADAADSLAMILQLLGHQTRCVSDPYKVVDAAETFLPQVVFLDIGMPGLSGYDVAKLLRENAASQKTTLVALTGWGQPEDRRRTEEAGFNRRMGIPGEDLRGSHPATDFVAWYNGHPDYREHRFDLSQERVAVVGVGNVAVDVVRILCRTPEELAATDISDDALAALRESRYARCICSAGAAPPRLPSPTPRSASSASCPAPT